MADIKLSTVSGGNGGLPSLAEDLTFPSSTAGSGVTFKTITGINPVGSLTTALSLSGKFAISFLQFSSLTAETITIKMTVDGLVVWNDTFTSGASISLYGSPQASQTAPTETTFTCKTSLLLEIQTTSDSNVTLNYIARPIL